MGISVEVEARGFGSTITVCDYDIDRIEWWEGIRANMLEVLERDGRRRCPVCGKPLKGNRKYCCAESANWQDWLPERTRHTESG